MRMGLVEEVRDVQYSGIAPVLACSAQIPMTAPLRSRSFVALALAVALVPAPGLAAPVVSASTPSPSTTTAPTTTTPPADATTPAPAEGTPTDATAPTDAPPEGEAPPEGTPAEAQGEPEKTEEPPPPAVPEGPERPPEPTLGNGKFKAKGTGLMIAGGTMLGLGAVGVITSFFLTRCPEPTNSFACKNQHNNTFAVPATGAVALLGAVVLAVGVTYRVRYRRWEQWDPKRAKTAFFPTLTPTSAGVGTVVNF